MMEDNFKFDTIEEAIEDFKAGKPVIVADDEDRENEGDLICSGQMVTPEIIKFMADSRFPVPIGIGTKYAI